MVSDAAGSSSSFLQMITARERGKLKIYIGSFAGVGKTYRILNEGNALLARGVDVVVGFIETHGRPETDAQVGALEIVPRRVVRYLTVMLEEMDVDAIISRAPAVALVDELAHSNVPGSKHAKRWEDVLDLLVAGVSVITAVNVQHVESLNDIVQQALGVTVRETVPDWVLREADEVVNLDLSSEDLRQRLLDGKIYAREKIASALENFFTEDNLASLRELALREVASGVDRRREEKAHRSANGARSARNPHRVAVALSSDPPYTQLLLRKASQIAGRLNTDWYCVYVQTSRERSDRIDSAIQRRLVENIQAAQAMGAEVVKLEGEDVAVAVCEFAAKHDVSLVIVGKSSHGWLARLLRGSVVDKLMRNTQNLDVLVAAFDDDRVARK